MIKLPERSHNRVTRFVVVVAAVVMAALVGGGVTYAATAQPAIKTKTPRSERDVTNIDVLRQQLRNYYGDPLGTGVAGAERFASLIVEATAPFAAAFKPNLAFYEAHGSAGLTALERIRARIPGAGPWRDR